jgi:hypothetical protein
MARTTNAAKLGSTTAASGARGERTRARRSRLRKEVTATLLAHVEALEVGLLDRAGSGHDSALRALRYLESGRPTQLPGQAQAGLNSAQRAKLAYAQADVVAEVIRRVLDGMGLTDEQFELGKQLTFDALKDASEAGWWPM